MSTLTKRIEKIEKLTQTRPENIEALMDDLVKSLSDSVKPAQPESEFVIVVEVPAEKDRPRKPLRKTHDPLAIRFYGPPDLDLF